MRKLIWPASALLVMVAAIGGFALYLRLHPPALLPKPPQAVAVVPPRPPIAPPLPVVEVPQRVPHAVHEDDTSEAVPTITIHTRSGRVIVPSRAGPVPREPPPLVPPVGRASALDGTTLTIEGRSVRLYGIRPPGPEDQCVLPQGSVGRCGLLAQETLRARLAADATVHCRTPGGAAAGAICHDAAGIDLGGLLVDEGLALADSRQSSDYLGAESIARNARRGLWRYR